MMRETAHWSILEGGCDNWFPAEIEQNERRENRASLLVGRSPNADAAVAKCRACLFVAKDCALV